MRGMGVCLSSFPAQEVDWGEYDTKGRAVGAACRLDLSVQVEAWPELTFKEFADRFHDKTQKEFRHAVGAARTYKQARLSGKPVPELLPPSYVSNVQQQAYTLYWEAAFLSAKDVERLIGGTPQSLGMGKGVVLSWPQT